MFASKNKFQSQGGIRMITYIQQLNNTFIDKHAHFITTVVNDLSTRIAQMDPGTFVLVQADLYTSQL